MGWVESLPYFWATFETARNVATWYVDIPVGILPLHKFIDNSIHNNHMQHLNNTDKATGFRYFVNVYIDDFIPMVIPTTQQQIQHVANTIMHGIHNIFTPMSNDKDAPISLKKVKKGNETFTLHKDLLEFVFNGVT